MSEKHRVVITLEGGLIQSIACSSKDVLFQIADWDALESGSDSLEFSDYVGRPKPADDIGMEHVTRCIGAITSRLREEEEKRRKMEEERT